MVTVGVAIGVLHDVQLSEVSGDPPERTDQMYAVPPTAVMGTLCPAQIVVSFNAAVTAHTYTGTVIA